MTLEQKRDALETKLNRLNADHERRIKTDMPGPFVTGGSGIPASRSRRLDAQLDREITKAVEYVETSKELERVKAKIAYQDNAPERERVKEIIRSKEQTRFESIEVGDLIDIGGNAPIRVIKKNKKTVVTDGGSKWEAHEICGVIKQN